MAGNSVPLLTITSPVQSQAQSRVKRAVVLTARVHPGETNGSWMMKGFIDFITGQSPDAKVRILPYLTYYVDLIIIHTDGHSIIIGISMLSTT